MDDRPSNYNFGFNIQGVKTRQFSLGSESSLPAPRVEGGDRNGIEMESWWAWWAWSLHDGLDCLGDGARSFNHSSFPSPPSETRYGIWDGDEDEDDGETVRFIILALAGSSIY